MATFYSPRIVTDGLVLHLDAGNNRSTFSGSSAWNDLSGLRYHASRFGVPPFSTDGGGCFDFSTVAGAAANAASMGFTFSSNMVPTTGNFTFECWIKNPGSASLSGGQFGMFANADGDNGYRFGPGFNGVYYLIGPTYIESVINWTSGYLNSGSWYHVVSTWDRTTTKKVYTYLNGTYENTGSMPSSQTEFQNFRIPGIVRSACCSLYTGKLAVMKVYNKLLSDAEIRQNYHATKGRFGL